MNLLSDKPNNPALSEDDRSACKKEEDMAASSLWAYAETVLRMIEWSIEDGCYVVGCACYFCGRLFQEELSFALAATLEVSHLSACLNCDAKSLI